MSDILDRLILLLKKHSNTKYPNSESEMCLFWPISNPPDILEGTRSLEAINKEFGLEVNEKQAVEMYDMNLNEASEYIQKLNMNS